MKTSLLLITILILTVEAWAEPCLVYWVSHGKASLVLNGETLQGQEVGKNIFMAKASLSVGDVLAFRCQHKGSTPALVVAVLSARDKRFLFGSHSDGWVSSSRVPKSVWYKEKTNGLLGPGNQRVKTPKRPNTLSRFVLFLSNEDVDVKPIWGAKRSQAFLKRTVSKRDMESK